MHLAPQTPGPLFVWTTPGTFTDFTNGSWDFGINFSVNTPTSVTALGYYDAGGDGFLTPHEVALFSSTGTLLASGTVTSADSLISGFRYLSIAPVNLGVGNYQIVGVSHSDLYSFSTTGGLGALLTVDPAISYLGDSYNSDSGLGAAFVGIGTGEFNNDAEDGFFGPDLLLGQATSVPEPLTLSLFAAGLTGVVVARRRRRTDTRA